MANDTPAGLDRTEHLRLLRDIVERAAAPTVLDIDTSQLGHGLPPTVPLLFDASSQRAIPLKDLIDQYRREPERRRGTANVTTRASFIDLVNRHRDEHSVIFAQTQWPEPNLTAVIDYHTAADGDGPHVARWSSHRIVYAFPLTEEFKAWVEGSGQAFDQLDFAAFLEEHAAELAAPTDGERSEFERLFKERFATPAEVLQLSRHLEVHVGQRVKRQERLASGERVVEFTDEHTNSKGEKVDVPGIFMVSVPAFVDGDPVRIPARLRYRLKGGAVVWFFQLYRWEFWLREEVQRDLATCVGDTGLPAFEGAPEA